MEWRPNEWTQAIQIRLIDSKSSERKLNRLGDAFSRIRKGSVEIEENYSIRQRKSSANCASV